MTSPRGFGSRASARSRNLTKKKSACHNATMCAMGTISEDSEFVRATTSRRVPCDDKADRADLQSRLPLLLLSGEGGDVRAGGSPPPALLADVRRRFWRRTSGSTSHNRTSRRSRSPGRAASRPSSAWTSFAGPSRCSRSTRKDAASTTPCRRTRRCWTTPGASSSRNTSFLVGVSIDGPADLHDRYRVDKQARPTFERVMQGDWRPQEAPGGVQHADGREPRQLPAAPARLPVPERDRVHVPAVHSPGGADCAGAVRRSAGADKTVAGPAADAPDGPGGAVRRGHGLERPARRLGPVPDHDLRRLGAPRHRARLRAAFRCGSRHLAGRRFQPVRLFRDLRPGAGDRAQRRPVLLRPLCVPGIPSRQRDGPAPPRDGPVGGADGLWSGQGRHAAPLLPRLRGPVRVPGRMPQTPLPARAGRRVGAELPLRGLPPLFQPH